MFGFSLTQLFLVCMVALAVLGPKQTVEFAYSLGRQIGRCKRFLDECKKEIDLQKISANEFDLKRVERCVISWISLKG